VLRLSRGTFFYKPLSCLKTLFFLSSPIPLPPFFFLLQTLFSPLPSCPFPLSIAAIPFIHRSHPLYPSQPSPLSIAAIPSIHRNHLLYPSQPSPLSTSAILSIHRSHPLYSLHPSPLSTSTIPSLHRIHPLTVRHQSAFTPFTFSVNSGFAYC